LRLQGIGDCAAPESVRQHVETCHCSVEGEGASLSSAAIVVSDGKVACQAGIVRVSTGIIFLFVTCWRALGKMRYVSDYQTPGATVQNCRVRRQRSAMQVDVGMQRVEWSARSKKSAVMGGHKTSERPGSLFVRPRGLFVQWCSAVRSWIVLKSFLGWICI